MGFRRECFFVCDWCGVEAPAQDRSNEPAPPDWSWHDYQTTLLCGACKDARTDALKAAKASRIVAQQGRPVDITKVTT